MTKKSPEIPKVFALKPIAPTSESARSDHLEYENLEPAVAKHKAYETARFQQFLNAEEGSIEELEAAQQLAVQYMLMGSLALQHAVTPASKDLWSDRYTKATSEIYGKPEAEIAKKLENSDDTSEALKHAAEVLSGHLRGEYAAVFAALEVEDELKELEPEVVAQYFEKGLEVLGDQYDDDWREWSVERREGADSLSVVAGEKKIAIGMKRATMKSEKLKPLFAHEVLVHAQRGLNGFKTGDRRLATGLPEYLDVEEGLGVFFEYALSGEVPEKSIDRYVDVAYALGLIDGSKHTREETLVRVFERLHSRNELALSKDKKSEDDIKKEAYAHVNRIYRGSLGDEHVGVFTKDIAYYNGFLKAGNYIKEQLETGHQIDEIMAYVLQGKFDPTNETHSKYIENIV